jgi:hypothetical protein
VCWGNVHAHVGQNRGPFAKIPYLWASSVALSCPRVRVREAWCVTHVRYRVWLPFIELQHTGAEIICLSHARAGVTDFCDSRRALDLNCHSILARQ